jgi:hypothetical protein
MEMLEDVAVYLILAPVAASLALGAVVIRLWLAGRRQAAPIRVHVRPRR